MTIIIHGTVDAALFTATLLKQGIAFTIKQNDHGKYVITCTGF